MSSDDADNSRRRFLTAATVVVGATGTAVTAVPFVASWSPSERAKTAGASVDANIGKLKPGQQKKCWYRCRHFPVRFPDSGLPA